MCLHYRQTLIMLMILLLGCSGKEISQKLEVFDEVSDVENEFKTKELRLRQTAAIIAAELDDRQLAAQVIISGIDGRGELNEDMKNIFTQCPAGAVMFFRYNLATDSEAIQKHITETVEFIANEYEASIMPFIAIDHEGGSVNRFMPEVAPLPAAGSYIKLMEEQSLSKEEIIQQIFKDSSSSGKIIKSLGFNMNFAPVAEYLNDDNQIFLESRAYSKDIEFTSDAAAAFIDGMKHNGILCVVKHFPGIAGPDPHFFPSKLEGGKEKLNDLASPFAALIRNSYAQAIMVSHSLMPAIDNDNVASLSKIVIDTWLRHELGFNGIIICDDFSMAAATNNEKLSQETLVVRSLVAGADMVMAWPPDIKNTHMAILTALEDGRLKRERLVEAAEKIIYEKLQMGLINCK